MPTRDEPLPPADEGPVERTVRRLQQKLAKRNAKIEGLRRRVALLESALATQCLEMQRLPRDVTRAVQDALCNVRMIPVIGAGKNARIVKVESSDA